jgi:DNA-binding HxlR family transcriptional regulator
VNSRAAEAELRDRLRLAVSGPASEADIFSSICPSRVVLDHVTSKWGVLVIVALADSTLRWGELKRCVEGISEKMLGQTLRILEGDGLVLREAYPTVPPRVDYSLTALGRDLSEQLMPLLRWVAANSFDIVGTEGAIR